MFRSYPRFTTSRQSVNTCMDELKLKDLATLALSAYLTN
jgi:hypothetical protein